MTSRMRGNKKPFMADISNSIKTCKKLLAFTLAEVLITLGIIGVVAALTIGVVINKYRQLQYDSLKKKALSVLSQTYLKIQAETESYPEEQCKQNDSVCVGKLFASRMNILTGGEWVPSQDVAKNCWEENIITANKHENHYCIETVDGIVFDFDMEYNNSTKHSFKCYIDVNGIKKPNKIGTDRYILKFINNKPINCNSVYVCDE